VTALAQQAPDLLNEQVLPSLYIYVGTVLTIYLGYGPLMDAVRRREAEYDTVLRQRLLMSISPRSATVISAVVILFLALVGRALTSSLLGAALFGAVGVYLPTAAMKYLSRRRLNKLEGQLVGAIQTLASGVRAGLNLVQSMQIVARDGPVPIRQEFAHLLREYEYGVSLEAAMSNAARRIGSGDFRLLFSALQTHRERGGDLGETLDRIADSIREIQRLENRVKTLTAQGRATARWLSAMPWVVLAIMYLLVDPDGVRQLFIDSIGKVVLAGIIVLGVLGYLWLRKVVAIDI
jgi:tight adherence protein B